MARDWCAFPSAPVASQTAVLAGQRPSRRHSLSGSVPVSVRAGRDQLRRASRRRLGAGLLKLHAQVPRMRQQGPVVVLHREHDRLGWTPESVVLAVKNNDWTLLAHSGYLSVQLQQPGTKPPAAGPPQLVPAGANGNGNGARK